MTPKPQANTLDEILEDNNILVGTGAKLNEIGYERLGENIQSAKQQLLAEVLDMSPKQRLNNQPDYLDYPPMYSQGYNAAVQDYKDNIKERFK